MTGNHSADFHPIISRSAARERFREAIRLYVGRGKRYSVQQAAKGSGVHPRMIESFIASVDSPDYRKPDIEEVLSLSAFLGPEFTSEWLDLAEQGAFLLPDSDGLPPGALAADNAEDNADLTRAAMDGKFERAEKPRLHTVGVRMMTRGAKLAAIGRAA